MITFRSLGHQGRLGNQLFQIAATVAIALQQHDIARFPPGWQYRPYFSLPDELFGEIPDTAREASDFATHLDPRARPYLQDINLFKDHLPRIVELFQPSALAQESLGNYRIVPNSVGVHVRRGDNVVDPGVPNKYEYHLCPSLDYYESALMALPSQRPRAIFSDDYPWVHEHMPGASVYGDAPPHLKENDPQYLQTTPHDWVDFFLLAQCRFFVLSGSTFSIWAALLAGARGGHVVRPDRVYGPMLSYIDESLLFLPDWTVIPNAPIAT
jgi:hypothetical protein